MRKNSKFASRMRVCFIYLYLCVIGLVYKATPMNASIDSQVLLRLRPYPMRGHWLLYACLLSQCHRVTLHRVYECSSPSLRVYVCGHVWRQKLTCVVYIHCRQLDKFKPGEVCNLVWGVAQLSPQADVDLLHQVLQASPTWSEVSTHALAPSITITHTHKHTLACILHNTHISITTIHTHTHTCTHALAPSKAITRSCHFHLHCPTSSHSCFLPLH